MSKKRLRSDGDDAPEAASGSSPTCGPHQGQRSRPGQSVPAMHPRNRYRDVQPDFTALAKAFPELSPFVTHHESGSASIDWTDVDAQIAVTRALLSVDFGLHVTLPKDRLCPPVPNRLNYVHWLAELMELPQAHVPRHNAIKGIDIGTGASCIYPLLGHACYGWSFVATEVDPVSAKWARSNVERNQLQQHIDVVLVPDASLRLCGVIPDGERYDFCMCNPPFFEDVSMVGNNPRTVCNATLSEAVVAGGDAAFVDAIITDSCQLKDRITWYTSMLGRKKSLTLLRRRLRAEGVVNVREYTLYQGRTTRWVIAWSWTRIGLVEMAEEKLSASATKEQKGNTTMAQVTAPSVAHVMRQLVTLLNDSGVEHVVEESTSKISGCLYDVTRIANDTGQPSVLFGFEVRVLQSSHDTFVLEYTCTQGDAMMATDFLVLLKAAV